MEYYCKDCGDDFISSTVEKDCTNCLSSNIIKTKE